MNATLDFARAGAQHLQSRGLRPASPHMRRQRGIAMARIKARGRLPQMICPYYSAMPPPVRRSSCDAEGKGITAALRLHVAVITMCNYMRDLGTQILICRGSVLGHNNL